MATPKAGIAQSSPDTGLDNYQLDLTLQDGSCSAELS